MLSLVLVASLLITCQILSFYKQHARTIAHYAKSQTQSHYFADKTTPLAIKTEVERLLSGLTFLKIGGCNFCTPHMIKLLVYTGFNTKSVRHRFKSVDEIGSDFVLFLSGCIFYSLHTYSTGVHHAKGVYEFTSDNLKGLLPTPGIHLPS